MASEAVSLPAANQPHSAHPGARNEPSDAAFLRGSSAQPSKSGYQKRLDRLTRDKYAMLGEIAELRRSNAELTLALAKAERLISRYKGALLKRT